MGFDCFMEVIGKCTLRKFIQVNRDIWLESYQKDNKLFIKEAQEYSAIINNRSLFIQRITEITFDDFKIDLDYYDEEESEENEEEGKFLAGNYSHLIFCEILLSAIDQQDPNLVDYLKVFKDVEDLSVKENNVKITIFYESSYKGSDELDIDFYTIHMNITKLQEIYPSIHIYTNLGISH